jgi:hypothetical protein
MNANYAPICLFVYNRPLHTQRTVEALLENTLSAKSDIFIFSDGAKNQSDLQKVKEVRRLIKSIVGFKHISIVESNENHGLANSIVSGVSDVIQRYGRIIVIEDDIVTSPLFLRFMNESLNLYNNDENVASIHGYVYPIENLPNTFFLRGADCWGWATWARAWSEYEPNGKKILTEIKYRGLEREIDFNYSTNYIKMLKNQINGKNDSWAIRWHLSAYLKGRLTLYPGTSFVRNIGNDNSGQHSKATNVFDSKLIDRYNELEKIETVENLDAKKEYEIFYRKNKKNIFEKALKHFIYITK